MVALRAPLLRTIAAAAAWIALAAAAPARERPAAAPLPPRTPVIESVHAGALPAHVDYVRLTYVLPGGETAPSAEIPNGVATGVVTRVDAPDAAPGALGYDVYAVANNGDTDMGHVLQNDAPIPFGRAFVEPSAGWRVTGRRLSAPVPDRTVEAVALEGQSVAVPRTPSIGGNVVFARSDAPEPGVVTIATVAATAAAPGGFDFTFDRDVRFADLPSFYLIAAGELHAEDPAVLVLRDETENRTIATYDKSEFGPMAFLSRFWHDAPGTPFEPRAEHRYSVRVSSRPATTLALATQERQDFVIGGVAGISAELHVPPASDGDPTPLASISASAPLGVPDLASSACGAALAYASVTVRAPATFDGEVSAKVHLPRGSGAAGSYAVALYDEGFWARGWSCGVARGRASGDTVGFDVDLEQRRLHPRTYVLALYAEGARPPAPAAPPPAAASGRRPVLAVVGDSMSLVTFVSPSGLRCATKIEAAPNCQMQLDAGDNYATLAGTRAGYRVVNLSHVGAQSTVDWILGEAAETLEVPQIPPDSAVVVIACGLLDNSENGFRDVSDRVDELTRAVRAAAPRSAIVYVGVRYFNDSADYASRRRAIDAWDDRERALAGTAGAFVDLRTVVPAGWSTLTPDGVHLTRAAHALVADRLQAALPPAR